MGLAPKYAFGLSLFSVPSKRCTFGFVNSKHEPSQVLLNTNQNVVKQNHMQEVITQTDDSKKDY